VRRVWAETSTTPDQIPGLLKHYPSSPYHVNFRTRSYRSRKCYRRGARVRSRGEKPLATDSQVDNYETCAETPVVSLTVLPNRYIRIDHGDLSPDQKLLLGSFAEPQGAGLWVLDEAKAIKSVEKGARVVFAPFSCAKIAISRDYSSTTCHYSPTTRHYSVRHSFGHTFRTVNWPVAGAIKSIAARAIER
jgi:hypothetical protein